MSEIEQFFMCLRTISMSYLFIIFVHFVLIVVFLLVWVGGFLCVRYPFSGYEFQITFTNLSLNVAYGVFPCLSFNQIGFTVAISQAQYCVSLVCALM